MSNYHSSGGGVQPLLGAMIAVGGSAKLCIPGWSYRNTAETVPVGDDKIVYIPIFVHRTHTFEAIVVYGGFGVDWGVNALARMGLYSAQFDADDYLIPDARLNDWGTISLDTAGSHEIVINKELNGDTFYFLALATHAKGGANGTLDGPNEVDGVSAPITPWQDTHPGAAPNWVYKEGLTDVVDNGLPVTPAPTTGQGARYAQAFLRD